eukprot:2318168-Alexandrium_andersonii.AAC.1
MFAHMVLVHISVHCNATSVNCWVGCHREALHAAALALMCNYYVRLPEEGRAQLSGQTVGKFMTFAECRPCGGMRSRTCGIRCLTRELSLIHI